MKKIFVILLVFVLFLSGCSNNTKKNESGNINYMEAKEMIINDGAILIDVRSKEEYDKEHIDGAILMPFNEINEDSINNVVNSKESVIIVYCNSGNISSKALNKLKDLGYTNVYDLGSISNWKE